MTHRFAPSGVSTDAWDRLTLFQQAVYRALTDIPAGETRSYQWIANRIRRPGSARAVGNALHQNPFAPTVPCHRVIRSDGSLGGYAHGIARKRELLRQEGWRAPIRMTDGRSGSGLRVLGSGHVPPALSPEPRAKHHVNRCS